MVPLKLALRNFMAYRRLDPPLDFTGVHVACLSGPNGAGKSALLDAITWALWGQARARSDDDLVTLGQSEMEVELEFALGEERYRILRKRTRPGLRRTGQSVLELQVADPSTGLPTGQAGLPTGQAGSGHGGEGLFRPITSNTLRETQRQIEELLRLDYHTFINSALLLQGRADEFTLKAPGERKRVLGEVLGLSRYDRYEERARGEARRLEGELSALRGEMASLEAQAALRPQYETELQEVQQDYAHFTALAKVQEQSLASLQQSQQLRLDKQARITEARERARQAVEELQALARQEASALDRIRDYQEVLAQRDAIAQAAEEHQRTAVANQELNTALQRLVRLREEEGRLERIVEEARSQLTTEELLLQREAGWLREVAESGQGLQETLGRAEEELVALATKEARLAGLRSHLEELSQRLGVLQHANREMKEQGLELRAKVDQLGRPGATGVCPLCGSELGPEGHRRILQEYQQELERQRELYRANERTSRELQEERERRQRESKAFEERIAGERAAAQSTAATTRQALAEAERSAAELAPVQQRLAQVQEALAARSYAQEARASLAQVQSTVAALGYHAEEHQALQARLQELEPWLAAAQRLQEAERRLSQEEADLARVREDLSRWRYRLAQETERQAELDQALAALPDVTQDLAQARQGLESVRDRLTQASTALGRVQAQLERCRELEAILLGRRQEVAQRDRERGVYEELALAFSRRGVQALLIETTLPELEEEANRILNRMTDNRMHLRLATQRQTRSGATVETLDINIADELGTRGYELYSGGEAFRINFALRIALSKLLARRAGAPLPTLVMDEGFGTQDAAGREKLIEAVNAIADDFQRVLVVTHVDEVKDAFPVRIEVTKTPEGSQVEVF